MSRPINTLSLQRHYYVYSLHRIFKSIRYSHELVSDQMCLLKRFYRIYLIFVYLLLLMSAFSLVYAFMYRMYVSITTRYNIIFTLSEANSKTGFRIQETSVTFINSLLDFPTLSSFAVSSTLRYLNMYLLFQKAFFVYYSALLIIVHVRKYHILCFPSFLPLVSWVYFSL